MNVWMTLFLMASGLPAAAGPPRGPFPAPEPAQAWLAHDPGAAMGGFLHPAYRVIEGVSDGVYDFMRSHLIGNILPRRLTRSLRRSPDSDSYALLSEELSRKEHRFLARLQETYPIQNGTAGGPYTSFQLAEWRAWAAQEQVSVLIDSMKDALLGRYELESFGHASGRYARDPRNWKPRFLTASGILGGAFLYLNGMHAEARAGFMRLGSDLQAGMKIRSALQGDARTGHLANLELSYKDRPLTLVTEWGAERGHLRHERLGLKYQIRY